MEGKLRHLFFYIWEMLIFEERPSPPPSNYGVKITFCKGIIYIIVLEPFLFNVSDNSRRKSLISVNSESDFSQTEVSSGENARKPMLTNAVRDNRRIFNGILVSTSCINFGNNNSCHIAGDFPRELAKEGWVSNYTEMSASDAGDISNLSALDTPRMTDNLTSYNEDCSCPGISIVVDQQFCDREESVLSEIFLGKGVQLEVGQVRKLNPCTS
ncbi:hypothetical protein L9F63_021992 [Diploptera punctata]|uniref:Uncharacterized protein n=1 Tax=Diploptera punctata TaxID=6984 RepID=A0AAD8EBH2_DIPPU|nr:hypothetical protein L9F63_021992 [Diploptera punctata]